MFLLNFLNPFSVTLLVLAISVGSKKPSRVIMQKMLSPIVLKLKKIQNLNFYQMSNYSYELLRVYLIGLCNDKPANSLVQNQPEPNALYGCSKCEIAGHYFVEPGTKMTCFSFFRNYNSS